MAFGDVAVLDLLLTARYIGRPAFAQMEGDIAGLSEETSGLSRLGSAFNLLGDVLIGTGVAAAVGLGAAIEQSDKYQQALTRITAVMGLTGQQQNILSSQIMASSDQYGMDSTTIAEGSYFIMSGMQSLGYTANDVFKNNVIPDLAAFVKASGDGMAGSVDFQQASYDLLHILGALNVPINQWGNAMGDLTSVENTANVSQANLIQAMLRFLPTAAVVHMSVQQVAAVIGTLATKGVFGARAGTELAAGFRQMLTAGSAATELNKLGLSMSSFFDKAGKLKDISTIMELIIPKVAKLNEADRLGALTKLFGATGARAMLPLTGAGTLDIYNRLLGSEQGQGHMLNVANQLSNANLQGKLEKLKAALKNFAITLGTQVQPLLMPFADKITSFVEKITAALQKLNPQQLEHLLKMFFGLTLGGGVALKFGGGILGALGKSSEVAGAGRAAGLEKYAKELNDWRNRVGVLNLQTDETLAKDLERKRGLFDAAHSKWLRDVEALSQKSESNLNALMNEHASAFGAGPGLTRGKGEGDKEFSARRKKFTDDYRRMVDDNYKSAHTAALRDFDNELKALGPEPHLNKFLTEFEGSLPTYPLMPAEPKLPKSLMERFMSPFAGLTGRGQGMAALLGRKGMATGGFLKDAGHFFSLPSNEADVIVKGWQGALKESWTRHALTGLTFHFPKGMAGRLAEDAAGFDKHPHIAFLGGAMKDIGGGLLDKLKGFAGMFLNIVKMLPMFAAAALPVIAALLAIAGAIAIGILIFTRYRTQTEHVIQVIAGRLQPVFLTLAGIVMLAWGQIQAAWAKAQPAIDKAMGVFLKNLPKITPLFVILGVVVGTVLAVILAAIVGLVNGFLNALPFVIDFFSNVISLVGNVAQLVIDLFTNWRRIPQDVGNIFGNLWNIVKDALLAIWNLVAGFVTGVIGFFQGLWGIVHPASEKGAKATKDAVVTHLTDMKSKSKSIVDTMASNTKSSFGGLSTSSNSIFGQMAGDGCGQFANLQGCAEHHTAAMVSHVTQKTIDMKRKVAEQMGDLVNVVNGQAATLAAAGQHAGQALVDGLTGGIYSKKAAAMQAARDVAGSVDSSFRFRVQVQSPSKLFYEHGQNIVRGLVLGLDAGHGNVEKAMAGVAAAVSSHDGDLTARAAAGGTLPNASGPLSTMRVGQLIVEHMEGTGGGGAAPAQVGTMGQALAVQAIREQRYGPTQAVTNNSLLKQLDYQYRYAYQYTA